MNVKRILVASALLAFAPIPAEAKGCIKGALVGGLAGHMVHHGVVGALGGCAVGHHIANEKPKVAPTGDAATQSPPTGPPLPSPTQP